MSKSRSKFSKRVMLNDAEASKSDPHTRAAWRVNEFCRLVGVSRTSFYKAVKSGSIRVITIAGRTLVPANEVARLLGKEVA